MESVLSARLDEAKKQQGAAVMKRCGYTPSEAVRRLFDYAIKHDALPFGEREKPSKEEVRRRIALFDECHTKHSSGMTDDELREARLEKRYGFDAR